MNVQHEQIEFLLLKNLQNDTVWSSGFNSCSISHPQSASGGTSLDTFLGFRKQLFAEFKSGIQRRFDDMEEGYGGLILLRNRECIVQSIGRPVWKVRRHQDSTKQKGIAARSFRRRGREQRHGSMAQQALCCGSHGTSVRPLAVRAFPSQSDPV